MEMLKVRITFDLSFPTRGKQVDVNTIAEIENSRGERVMKDKDLNETAEEWKKNLDLVNQVKPFIHFLLLASSVVCFLPFFLSCFPSPILSFILSV